MSQICALFVFSLLRNLASEAILVIKRGVLGDSSHNKWAKVIVCVSLGAAARNSASMSMNRCGPTIRVRTGYLHSEESSYLFGNDP